MRAEVESLLASHQNADKFVGMLSQPSVAASFIENQDPWVGRLIGSYRTIRQIGRGGMASVYLGIRADDQYRKHVAIKLVLPGFDNEEILRRFRNERQTLAALDHPNIVKLLDGGNTEEGLPYLVMDYVEGVRIDQYCDVQRLSTTERLQLFRQVCAAVHHAHLNLVVHRDLKPSNILVTGERVPKLLDFGIAKLLNPEFAQTLLFTQLDRQPMTPEYASPEQIKGEFITTATDVYSLGVILYELLTGHRPYRLKRYSAIELGQVICEVEPLKPSTAVTSLEEIANPDASTLTTITPEDVSRTREGDTQKLRRRLMGDLDMIVLTALRKEPHRRYASVHDLSEDIRRHLEHLPIKARPSKIAYRASKFLRRHKEAMVPTVIAIVLLIGIGFFLFHPKHALGEKDTIVLADFANSTGDAVFDGTLKQALSVALSQSPFLNVLSDDQVGAALKMMARPANTPLTSDLARELCQRTSSEAYIAGSIVSLGGQYVVGLRTVDCQSGNTLAQQQVTATAKERVLKVLGDAAAKLRGELGESLPTVQRFDVPLEQATTSSLEALKAYSLGQRALSEKGSAAAIPFFERAVELDSSFASAEQALAAMYRNLDQPERAQEHLQTAVKLSNHLSERERLSILGSYYMNVTGEIEKAIPSYESLIQAYPKSGPAYGNLGVAYAKLGQYESALEITRQALRLNPDRVVNYENLGIPYLALGRFDEAREITLQALKRHLDDDGLHTNLYGLEFLDGDEVGMAEQAAWFERKPDLEDQMLALESDTEAYVGRLEKARELTRRAIGFSKTAGNFESAALLEGNAALREAFFGNLETGQQQAAAALRLAPGSRDAEIEAALALARVGAAARAQSVEQELAKRYPLNTQMQSYWLPTIRAEVSLRRGDTARAIESLKVAAPYDLANTMFTQNPSCMYPVYVRGQAYLDAGQGAAAANEFQKILDHRGLVWNCLTGALARLELGRSYALAGDTVRARSSYKDFLSLWKNADPDIAILKEANAEYAKLR